MPMYVFIWSHFPLENIYSSMVGFRVVDEKAHFRDRSFKTKVLFSQCSGRQLKGKSAKAVWFGLAVKESSNGI